MQSKPCFDDCSRTENSLARITARGEPAHHHLGLWGDEGILSCCINGHLLPVQHPLGIALIDYLLDYLPFSFVGPFSLQGQGVLVIKKEQVYLECQSTFEHFSEEEAPDSESWQGVRWEELLKGEFLLFRGEEGW